MAKYLPANVGDSGLILMSGRFPGEGTGNPLQHSCLENHHGQRSLVSYSSWGHRDWDTAEQLSTHARVNRETGGERAPQNQQKHFHLYGCIAKWATHHPRASGAQGLVPFRGANWDLQPYLHRPHSLTQLTSSFYSLFLNIISYKYWLFNQLSQTHQSLMQSLSTDSNDCNS